MSTPVPGSGSTESVPAWESPAQQDAARAASIESVLPQVDGVASVFPPAGAELAGFTPEGVKVSDERVEVHIIAEYGRPLQATADDIDAAVHSLLDGRNLQIVVDDILLPGESLPDPDAAAASEPVPADRTVDPETPSVATDPASQSDPGSELSDDTGRDTEGDDGRNPRGAESFAAPAADPEPQTGVTVTVAPETAAEVTVDEHGAVQVDVPGESGDPSGDGRAAGDRA